MLHLTSQAIKLQYNAGDGGCFPIHTDTDTGIDGRQITAIWYLNPDWKPEHGGQIRLYPLLGPPVDIDPLHDRLVLFSSADMPHRVLPSFAERCCFTIWLSGKQQIEVSEQDKDMIRKALSAPASSLDEAEARQMIHHPALRRHVMKWDHREEWEQSLVESHAPSPERDSMVEGFRQEVQVIGRALGPLLPYIENS